MAAIHFFYPSVLRGTLHTVLAPFWSVRTDAEELVSGTGQLFRSKQDLAAENQTLREQLAALQLALQSAGRFKEENQELKELVNRPTTEHRIAGVVLAKPPISLYDTLVIDVGVADGITEGSLAIVLSDIAIGRISQVLRHTSVVTLFSAPGEETPVVMGSQHITAIAIGRGGGTFHSDVPRDVEVEKGDIVTMPALNPRYFGIVETVTTDKTQPFKEVLFKNPINIAELQWVEVIPSFSESQPEESQ